MNADEMPLENILQIFLRAKKDEAYAFHDSQ